MHANDSSSTNRFTIQTLAEVAEDIAVGTMPAEHKVRILLAIVRAYTGPEACLEWYFAQLGANVVDAEHAIENAERGVKPHAFAVDDPRFGSLFAQAFSEVREVRQRRDPLREQHDRTAAALLATTRLMTDERSAAA
jgi:hypothetical protein